MSAEYITPDLKAETVLKEFEDFAYVVSHDLNAPLRHIREFTKLLLGAHKEKFSEEEQEYVDYLDKSLRRIEEMQQALLIFSRLNTRAGPIRETNFNDAVGFALGDLYEEMGEYQPVIDRGDLPSMLAEPKQMRLLFYHLIGNALKFHKPRAIRKQVSISARNEEKRWVFEMRDNGIGIEEKYYREIFRLFRRLDPEKYPGVGAGLAIAQRIVQRHGGEIWIESRPGEGTSVLFSIAK